MLPLPESKKKKKWGRWALAALVLLLAAWWMNAAPGGSRHEIFIIYQGDSAGQVARHLQQTGHVRSRRWFLLLTRLRGASRRLQAGVYELKAGQTASSILSDLVSGRARRARVTVPEGFASWQIAERLQAEGVCSDKDFRKAVADAGAEGYLFPETYFFQLNTPADRVVEAMRGHFEKAWQSVLEEALAAGTVVEVLPPDNPRGQEKIRLSSGRLWTRHEIVTLASLIEREARRDEERALISAVFYNRLKRRMRLESDPTVQFSLGYWKDRILYKDLDVASPYNTYRRFGLPPGPICSPGTPSLAAALGPAQSNYLYFVANLSGGHDFFETYERHLQGVHQRDRNRKIRKKATGH